MPSKRAIEAGVDISGNRAFTASTAPGCAAVAARSDATGGAGVRSATARRAHDGNKGPSKGGKLSIVVSQTATLRPKRSVRGGRAEPPGWVVNRPPPGGIRTGRLRRKRSNRASLSGIRRCSRARLAIGAKCPARERPPSLFRQRPSPAHFWETGGILAHRELAATGCITFFTT
jgi:hypothetical protein